MLAELTIENFAIIDRLSIRFSPGLTVLTGETGAGKSIIIDALQAALGARVSSELVRGEEQTAVVEAIFELPEGADGALRNLLLEQGIQPEDDLILRREISSSGRGSARVNGRAVPVSVLNAVGSIVADIHGQSEHLSILRHDRQLEALDRYGDLLNLRNRTADSIRAYVRLQGELRELMSGRQEAEQRLDLLRFQVQEIESADLRAGEEEERVSERKRLANAARLAELAQITFQALRGEAGAEAGVRAGIGALQELVMIDPRLQNLSERLEAAGYELQDLAAEVRRYVDEIEADPDRLEAIEERLDVLNRLKRKYGASIAEVLSFGRDARNELEQVESLDDRLQELEDRASAAETQATLLVEELSRARQATAVSLTAAMMETLQELGLKGTRFEVALQRAPSPEGLGLSDGERYAFTTSGVDEIAFIVSFNPGEPLRPFEKVASGGETSRFLLALKSVLAEVDQIPTLIFDEVDVGIGARHGMVVGEKLHELAGTHQVLAITHLPQIAALADEHVTVGKTIVSGRTTVQVRVLESQDRVAEIAEMMSGTGSEKARSTAEELLKAAGR